MKEDTREQMFTGVTECSGRSGSQSLAVATSASSPRAEDGAVGSTLPSLTQPPRERPILFSGPMVRAILEGRKTQTRRIVKFDPTPSSYAEVHHYDQFGNVVMTDGMYARCPYGEPGDRLWVRETWATYHGGSFSGQAFYRATEPDVATPQTPRWGGKWKPSIHMPRWASRITLEITGVRVERLHDISEHDARAEGVPHNLMASTHRIGFENLWNSIHGTSAFEKENPWVWVVEFRRVSDRSENPAGGTPRNCSEERGPRNEGDAQTL